MVGVVNPELLAFLEKSKESDDKALLHYLHSKRPDYIITHPNCYPHLFEDKGVLEEIRSIELTQHSGISAGRTMGVYKAYWDKLPKMK